MLQLHLLLNQSNQTGQFIKKYGKNFMSNNFCRFSVDISWTAAFTLLKVLICYRFKRRIQLKCQQINI